MTTLRAYWLILILLLAMIATISYSYGRALVESVERTVAQIQVQR